MNQAKFIAGAIIFFIIIAIPIFLNLGKQPIRIWDESRLAMNAYEMNKDGNYLVTHFGGKPDMWNTKPPLMIWLQVICIKILGFNEIALRLPSALAALLTCLLLVFFSKKAFDDYLPGLLASIILVTINGYIHIHAARTGDYDALLAFFTTWFCLAIFLFVHKKSTRYLHFFFAGVLFAVLTKSVQGLLFIPAIVLYIVLQKQLKLFLLNRWFYIDLFICVVIAVTYYLLRERYNPGYLQAIRENELGGRYLSTLEENKFSKGYYYRQIRYFLFRFWFWFIPAGFIAGYFLKGQFRNFIIYLSLLCASYFLLISFSETKLEWYTVPLFPLMAYIVGMFFYAIQQYLHRVKMNNALKPFIFLLFCALVFVYPYSQIVKKVYKAEEYSWDKDIYPIGYILQDAFKGKSSLDSIFICYRDYSTHLLVYMKALADKGQMLSFKEPHSLAKGDVVLASEQPVRKVIESMYQYEIVKDYKNAKLYRITGRTP